MNEQQHSELVCGGKERPELRVVKIDTANVGVDFDSAQAELAAAAGDSACTSSPLNREPIVANILLTSSVCAEQKSAIPGGGPGYFACTMASAAEYPNDINTGLARRTDSSVSLMHPTRKTISTAQLRELRSSNASRRKPK